MYAKIENGIIIPAPSILRLDGVTVINPTDDMLESQGYKPTVQTDRPQKEDGFFYLPSWTETESEIVQVWNKHKTPGYESEVDKILRGAYD